MVSSLLRLLKTGIFLYWQTNCAEHLLKSLWEEDDRFAEVSLVYGYILFRDAELPPFRHLIVLGDHVTLGFFTTIPSVIFSKPRFSYL